MDLKGERVWRDGLTQLQSSCPQRALQAAGRGRQTSQLTGDRYLTAAGNASCPHPGVVAHKGGGGSGQGAVVQHRGAAHPDLHYKRHLQACEAEGAALQGRPPGPEAKAGSEMI